MLFKFVFAHVILCVLSFQFMQGMHNYQSLDKIVIENSNIDINGFLASYSRNKDFYKVLPINKVDDLKNALELFIQLNQKGSQISADILKDFRGYLKDRVLFYYASRKQEIDSIIANLNPEQNACLNQIIDNLTLSTRENYISRLMRSCNCSGNDLCEFCCDARFVGICVFLAVLFIIIIPSVVISRDYKNDHESLEMLKNLNDTIKIMHNHTI